ncbi:MAG: Ig-like domain-containing protein [Candidatus Limnocylindria bacterium]
MISLSTARFAYRAPFASLSYQLRRHRAITRTLIAALSLALAAAVSAGGAAQAGLTAVLPPPTSILPVGIGVGIGTQEAVTLTFPRPMDVASVEAALSIAPAHPVRLSWSDDGSALRVLPDGLWSADTRYGMTVGDTARTAAGARLGAPARFSFTTQTAPRITDFGLHFVAEPKVAAVAERATAADLAGPPADTASDVSAGTSIQIAFSAPMNHTEVERAFTLSPAVPGVFRWDANTLIFTPAERLASGARYAVSLVRVHDRAGNLLGGGASFSFTTKPGAQLVQSTPKTDAKGVSDKEIALWFSQPVDPAGIGAALRVKDRNTGATLTGSLDWNAAGTQLVFTPSRALAAGHRFDVSLAPGAVDADGNPVTLSLTFTTKAAAVTRARVAAAPGPASTLVDYAFNQVNAARAAYGLKPLVLSSALSAVANEHSWDMLNNNYFSHTSLDGRTKEDRLRNAGISFGWDGENICYSYNAAKTATDVLNWCHAEFMSEPYPGYANHIGNILGTHYTRIGIGIAVSGAKVYITWDFTD